MSVGSNSAWRLLVMRDEPALAPFCLVIKALVLLRIECSVGDDHCVEEKQSNV